MSETNEELLAEVRRQRAQMKKKDKIRRYHHLNNFVRKGQIVFAGSSLMEQFPVYEMLLNDRLPYTIYNRGVGGFTTSELLEALDACIFELEPAHLFLNIGTNDLNGPDYDQAAMLGRYAQIIRAVRSRLPQVKLYLLAYYPVNPTAAKEPFQKEVFRHRTNAQIAAASAGVQRLAEVYDAEYLDLNAGLTDAEGNLKIEYTVDGMHMYANGYRIVWQNLHPTLVRIADRG